MLAGPATTAGSAAVSPSDPRQFGSAPPLVVYLNCLEDTSIEQESLSGIATVEHVPLSRLSDGRIESASVVLLHSLTFLPRAAQRRLRPWQLVLCLGSTDRAVDSALASDLGLRLVHVDANRAEEVADTVMALVLGLLRKTHLLSRYSSSSSAASGWLGAIQPLCRGMRRCRGLVLGIIGRSASARCLATRSLAFRMSVLYFDPGYEGKGKLRRPTILFPSAARRMDTLNDLLAASDLVSLHCAISNNTMHILNAECLQHIKPGAFIINTGSCQLIDDCALKQLLIEGTIAGCALDGAEGPQWMEAWVREMPNVLILPRSADYSEDVWMEIREKSITILQSYLLDGVMPSNSVSEGEADEEDEEIDEAVFDVDNDPLDKRMKEDPLSARPGEESGDHQPLQTDDSQLSSEYDKQRGISQLKEPQSVPSGSRSEGRRSGSRKKGKKRPARRRSKQKIDESSAIETDDVSGRDQVLSSSSRFASPEDLKSKSKSAVESTMEVTSSEKEVCKKSSLDLLKDGFVISLRARDQPGFHVARQRLPGGGWFLDVVSNVTKRDPAAQFLVTLRSKDTIGLRSFVSGGKLLQINRKMEFVFASHSFDVWETWMLEGSSLEECRLVNCRNPLAMLDICVEILAVVSEEDGITRWVD
ncbi:C-terminal-binding protein [Rhynchospora pubera]|uniref:C-terminal-binding protein n=1 Tax=Rhynchospora pubera TaxID=906938 RepID=A0AAV8EFA9_9POAL|nr:C-terminal-binding protein [Rhynchospora pubera]